MSGDYRMTGDGWVVPNPRRWKRLRWRLRLARLRWRYRRLQWQYQLAEEAGDTDWAAELWPQIQHARRRLEIVELSPP